MLLSSPFSRNSESVPWATLSNTFFCPNDSFCKEDGAVMMHVCFRSELYWGPFLGMPQLERGALLKMGAWAYPTEGWTVNLSFSLVDLKVVFSSGKRLYLLKVGFLGTAIERTLVQEHPQNIYLLDIDWKRNLIYWTSAQGHLFCSTGYSGKKQAIWTERAGQLGWLFGICPFFFFGSKITKNKKQNKTKEKTLPIFLSKSTLMPKSGF